MTMDRHDSFEELISASLQGDLTAAERDRLDAHLDTCAACRATLASFADQRRIMGGLRHLPPPRDLDARIRTGIERGAFAPLPWWRRPPVIFAGVGGSLAVVAGALLALVVLNPSPDEPSVGDASPTVSAAATISPSPTASGPPASPEPNASPAESPAPTPTPHPIPPASIGYGAVNYLQWEGTLQDQQLTLRGWNPEDGTSAHLLDLAVDGQAVAASFSPDSEWLAYQVATAKGTNRIVVVHLMSTEAFELGETPDGSVFSERMTWSPDSRYLAYTTANVDEGRGSGPDAWAFDTESQVDFRLTFTYATYAASFTPDGLWVSVAGDEPVSHLIDVELTADGPLDLRGAGAGLALQSQAGIFQPVLSPNGDHAIFWRGRMADADGAWSVQEGGMLYLSGEPVDGQPSWSGEPLFPELAVDRDALGSAHVAWSFDSDRFAVWGVQWRGVVQDAQGAEFPNDHLVYFGGAAERDLITSDGGALAFVDPESSQRPVDVTFVDRDAVAVTIFESPAGESGESPVAGSRLIVSPLAGTDGDLPQIGPDVAWVGPALYVPQGDE